MIGTYGAYGRTSRKSPLYVWKAKCEGARAAKAAGKKQYASRDVDKQIGEWCSREGEWLQEERKRAAETEFLETAAEPLAPLPTIDTALGTTRQGPNLLPIIAFVAIAGIGGYILYRRK